MKITIIHNILWSHYTGKVFSELNKVCLANGHELKVIQIALTMEGRKNIGDIDYNVHDYPFELLFKGAFEDTRWYDKTQSIYLSLKKDLPDVLILSGYEDPSNWFLMVWAKLRGIKLAITADSTEKDRPRVFYKEWFKKLILKLPSLVMCYGEAPKQYLRQLNIPENKIRIRVQATDNEKTIGIFNKLLNTKSNLYPKYNFLFVGRFVVEKNLFSLLDAFKSIQSDWGLVLVGDGVLESALKNHVQEKDIKNVFFEGPKNTKEVIQYYKNHDVFILPSVSEPWGLVVNEAMLCQMPVLVSSHCGCAYELVNENGSIFDPMNVQDIADSMQKIMRKVNDFKQMGQKSLEIASKFTPEKAAQQMFDAIISL